VPGEPEILVHAHDDLPAALREQIVMLHRQAWPGDPAAPPGEPGPIHDPALRPVSLALVAGDRLLAALDILSKDIDHAGERYAASGLSTVVTDEELRGRGYGHRLVSAARDAIERSGADLGIFTCDRPLGPFYESAGWSIIPGAVLIGGTADEPFPSDQWDKVTLARFFTAKAKRGAPTFTGARIALHPGPVDKLW
jgi:aminoglycoside 2'-N-acetyltransferase I